jgi:hypothetical protein
MNNYFEIEKPLREAIKEVGTVALYKGDAIPLWKALEMVGSHSYGDFALHAKAVAIATESVLALKK